MSPTSLPPRRRPSPGHPPDPGAFERVVGAVFGVGFAGLMVSELVSRGGAARWSVPFFLLAWAPLLVLHELGHAVAARLVGWRLEQVVIGHGPVLTRFAVAGVAVELRVLPLQGHVAIAARARRGLRWKSALVYFMGPGMEPAFVAAVLVLAGSDTLLVSHVELPWIAVQAACAAALVGAVTNLIPFTGGDMLAPEPFAPRTPSDGLGVLLSLFLPRARLVAWLRPEADSA